ncbi:hypothetical protein A3J90_04150 [candidate division WOR-1 bacterium RIFOXYC2_FULL_37_10]|uniref:Prevent-host-death protein n=1 Tax=candidate division WOR-1 bacterium RIFOXYB2_FULL_37_13 TaxID=1802579 RepID=A0A1F4SHF8_UNCSA|nr:MAG: hypothetical protein A2246_04615 [candidate division WOR-1 bacterium RIFOXYA2_FULL_37_7]OGC19865.1 MAG: hypothetical protein A2310_05900 [candidate division WOR-1 bacterium RIFOXYB2_FULL_37_13]OGC32967.1 MAG: hypothetical protein A3J90_04150 [candidate division WOR-1 bacterium RIFOXYC2_FULL_37_10]
MLKTAERFIVNEKGEKQSIILDFRTYEEMVEDLEDLYSIAERKNESTISFDELKRKVKKSGIL